MDFWYIRRTHHFDMVNWWIDQTPDVIYANGDRRFYGPTRKETARAVPDLSV